MWSVSLLLGSGLPTSALLMFNLATIFYFIFEVDEATSQREISSSHSHLWPTAITKYAAGFILQYCNLFSPHTK